MLVRVPLRPCDDECLRQRGGSFLRVMRLAHRTPARTRRLLHAFDLPYARLWMAWLAHRDGDSDDARASLAEARAQLSTRASYAAELRAALTSIAAAEPPTLGQELVAELRVQLDHWARVDRSLGLDAAVMFPCTQLAMEGRTGALALRPRGDAVTDELAIRVANRCAKSAIDESIDEAERAPARAALDELARSIVALAPTSSSSDAAATNTSDEESVRARLGEPLWITSAEPDAVDERAMARNASDPATGARVTAWLRARTTVMTPYASALCAVARRGQPTITPAQCAQRAGRAASGAAVQWLSRAGR